MNRTGQTIRTKTYRTLPETIKPQQLRQNVKHYHGHAHSMQRQIVPDKWLQHRRSFNKVAMQRSFSCWSSPLPETFCFLIASDDSKLLCNGECVKVDVRPKDWGKLIFIFLEIYLRKKTNFIFALLATHYRISKLLQLQKKIGSQPYLSGLFSVYRYVLTNCEVISNFVIKSNVVCAVSDSVCCTYFLCRSCFSRYQFSRNFPTLSNTLLIVINSSPFYNNFTLGAHIFTNVLLIFVVFE